METLSRHDNYSTHDNPRPIVHQDTSSSAAINVSDEKGSTYNIDDNSLKDDSDPASSYRNGEPVITTGQDVSRFVVDIRDDEDPALTFRSMFLGTLFAGMGAALSQVSNQRS